MENDYRHEFIAYALNLGVLKFGEFTLKSGRVSPYFFNAGLFNSGNSLMTLSKFYARVLQENIGHDFMLYGPAYKGIPLAAATSVAMAAEFQRDIPYAFNRKEVKAHGEGGMIVGAPLRGDVVIIDDVITAGTSIRESFDIIENAGARTCAVVIALDRQERLNDSAESAVSKIQHEYKVPVYAVATMADLLVYAKNDPLYADCLPAIEAYRNQYGTE